MSERNQKNTTPFKWECSKKKKEKADPFVLLLDARLAGHSTRRLAAVKIDTQQPRFLGSVVRVVATRITPTTIQTWMCDSRFLNIFYSHFLFFHPLLLNLWTTSFSFLSSHSHFDKEVVFDCQHYIAFDSEARKRRVGVKKGGGQPTHTHWTYTEK